MTTVMFRRAVIGYCLLYPLATLPATYPIPDLTYGGAPDGIARVAFNVSSSNTDFANSGALLPDGRLILGGAVETGPSVYDFGLAKLDGGGIPDPAFGPSNDGRVLADMAPTLTFAWTAPTADGHILFLGNTTAAVAVLARLDAAGAYDTTFNGTGRHNFGAGFFVDAGTSLVLSEFAVLPNGKIIVAGYAGSSLTVCAAVARLNSDGSTDTTFGGGDGGACESPVLQGTRAAGAYAMTVAPDGHILLAGTAIHSGGSGFDMAVVRFTADGMLDTTFGPAHDGWAYVGFDEGGDLRDAAYAIALDRSGRIVLAGTVDGPNDSDIGVARLLSDGSPDAAFGSNGRVSLDLALGSDGGDFVHSVFVRPDGQILVGGESDNTGTAILFKDDGTLDTAFGNSGIFVQADPGGDDSTLLAANRLVLSGDYMYMIGSINSTSTHDPDFAAARYVLPLFTDGFDGD